MILEWSADALADLNRFAAFLQGQHPSLAARVAAEIIAKSNAFSEHPTIGRLIGERPEYRQVTLRVLNAAYVFQYLFNGERLVMLRIFHGREARE